jgi:hypothetical protein
VESCTKRQYTMGNSNASKTEGKAQIERFRETARELQCDESEEAFRHKLRTIARPAPKDDKPKNTRRAK